MNALVLLVVITAACSKRNAPVDAGSISTPLASAALGVPDAHADAEVAAKTITSDDRKAYLAALRKGRSLTLAKKYDDAEAAFTAALDAIPDDGRALGERGYAFYLAHDDARAKADFAHALAVTPASNKVLAAQLEYNLGLVADRSDDPDEKKAALAHFVRSNELNPTDAAKKHIPTACVATTWVPTFNTYASEADAIKALGGGIPADVDTGAKVLSGGTEGNGQVLVPIAGGKVSVVDVGIYADWRCGKLGEVSVEKLGDVVHVVYQAHRGVATPGVCYCEDMPKIVCDPGECRCQDPVCPTICGGADSPEGEHIEAWLDAKTGAGLGEMKLDHDDLGKATPVFDAKARTLSVTGPGCP